jgi:alpha(1,3/1,4) fucosyltransferase
MIKASIIVDNDYSKNRIFDDYLNKNIFDGRSFKYIALKRELYNYGINLVTHDMCDHSKTDIYIYLDSINRVKTNSHAKKFLIIIEPPSVYPKNHKKSIENIYDKIFTWDDDIIDNSKYFKYNFSFDLNSLKKNYQNIRRSKLSVMICRNKVSRHKNELYSKREEVIRWHEKNMPSNFDLYGKGWDELKIKTYPFTFFNRYNFFGKFMNNIFQDKLNVYKGQIKSKSQVLSNYKFSYTYENIEGVNGYITEKLFDSFFSLTIPIYRGAKNIKKYIPEEIFIDSNQFDSVEDISNYIQSFDNSKLKSTQNDIIDFFSSEKAKVFCSKFNAELIAKHIYESVK